MTTNIATTKEQSVRLLQCGVDPETADMTFTPHNTLSADPYKEALKDRGYFPTWSLSALLELVPKTLPNGFKFNIEFEHGDTSEPWWITYADERYWQCFSDKSPIEACVQAIEWLTANNYKLNQL